VYAALTKARLHAAFIGGAATGRAREGYAFTAWDGYISGRHLRLAAPRRIVQEWSTSEWPRGLPPSVLDLRLEPARAGTRIVMVQSGVPARQAARLSRGWRGFYWEPMRAYFSG
jgi:activator of HSP90 ATPase